MITLQVQVIFIDKKRPFKNVTRKVILEKRSAHLIRYLQK